MIPTDLISDVGFPIGAFLLMWYSHNTTLNKLTNEFKRLTETIKNDRRRK